MKYFLYARKSSESEDRQIQSIDDQLTQLKELADKNGLTVKDVLSESKSAKQPGNRPVFNEMLSRIENGEADGILCWQINRLSRNPIDSGRIQWLLQNKVLKSIQTMEKEHLPDDNVLLLSVESGMANQYIIDLSKNVKRGLASKLAKGWMPNQAPLGYLNDKVNKTIIKDPVRAPLIRKMWDLMLTGNYSPKEICTIANKDWGFRTRKYKKIGGKEVSLSCMYSIFNNLYYVGINVYNGIQYNGLQEPIITLDEYERVQSLLGKKGKPRPQKHEFSFSGLIRCAECGCLYTAEIKSKYIKSTKQIKKYTYYHCTRKKKEIACLQRQCISEQEIEKQIDNELTKITIIPEFRDWALEVINKTNDKEIATREKIHENISTTLFQTQNELNNLTRLRCRELISEEEYLRERTVLSEQTIKLRSKLQETEHSTDLLVELNNKTFNFAVYARKAFATGDKKKKREIAMGLGSNYTIINGKLALEPLEWLKPIEKDYPQLEREYLDVHRLEPDERATTVAKEEALSSIHSRWLGDLESNQD